MKPPFVGFSLFGYASVLFDTIVDKCVHKPDKCLINKTISLFSHLLYNRTSLWYLVNRNPINLSFLAPMYVLVIN